MSDKVTRRDRHGQEEGRRMSALGTQLLALKYRRILFDPSQSPLGQF